MAGFLQLALTPHVGACVRAWCAVHSENIREVRFNHRLQRHDSSRGHFICNYYGDGAGWLRGVRPALVLESTRKEGHDRRVSAHPGLTSGRVLNYKGNPKSRKDLDLLIPYHLKKLQKS